MRGAVLMGAGRAGDSPGWEPMFQALAPVVQGLEQGRWSQDTRVSCATAGRSWGGIVWLPCGRVVLLVSVLLDTVPGH